jgi:hypothetical protein
MYLVLVLQHELARAHMAHKVCYWPRTGKHDIAGIAHRIQFVVLVLVLVVVQHGVFIWSLAAASPPLTSVVATDAIARVHAAAAISVVLVTAVVATGIAVLVLLLVVELLVVQAIHHVHVQVRVARINAALHRWQRSNGCRCNTLLLLDMIELWLGCSRKVQRHWHVAAAVEQQVGVVSDDLVCIAQFAARFVIHQVPLLILMVENRGSVVATRKHSHMVLQATAARESEKARAFIMSHFALCCAVE